MNPTTLSIITTFLGLIIIALLSYLAWKIWRKIPQMTEMPSQPLPQSNTLNPNASAHKSNNPPPQMELPLAVMSSKESAFTQTQFQQISEGLNLRQYGENYILPDRDGNSPLLYLKKIPLVPQKTNFPKLFNEGDFAGFLITLKLPVSDPANLAVEVLLTVAQNIESQYKGQICSPESHSPLNARDLENYRRAGQEYVKYYRQWQKNA